MTLNEYIEKYESEKKCASCRPPCPVAMQYHICRKTIVSSTIPRHTYSTYQQFGSFFQSQQLKGKPLIENNRFGYVLKNVLLEKCHCRE
jgi:hypothetical protein